MISWLSARQYAPEGGFSGRTNKLVDGCYSHWVGGCWPLLEACLEGPFLPEAQMTSPKLTVPSRDGSLYSREGLIRYILSCCQDTSNRGGLRDKPSQYAMYLGNLSRFSTDLTIVTLMHITPITYLQV